ncbi:hypothetical protein D9757_007634 [Collybiopsis confluens]|uniref:Yeast cell wall synthesis Kre9/Knh1-like N-terminal domain-containing protein n=1 Tax=Collybiopsis confluens TaxID=2823264 RepID=A0A8H5M3F1_9AGAR|nr:hypothetical protein D9757_007634 [Collybiopsis confluens]
MRASLAAVALLPACAFATFSIQSPSSSEYWVFNTSNAINWTSTSGDPESFNIAIINANNATLNGAFSIASGVANNLSFEVTNVTLNPGDNYFVQFVNSSNITQVFVNSSSFTVKPNGSTPAPIVSASSSASGSSGSGTGASGSSASSTAAGASSSNKSSAADLLNPKSALIAAGVMALAALVI